MSVASNFNLVRYDAARTAVAECRRIDEAKDIADKAQALQAYARQAKDSEMESWVAEIRLRARRRVGELSAVLGTAPSGRAAVSLPNDGKSKSDALHAAGLSTSEAHRCEQIARVPETVFESYIAEKKSAGKAVSADEVTRVLVKNSRKADVASVAEMATMKTADLVLLQARGMKFATILADPPWQYGNQSTRGATSDHYCGMTVEEISELPIASLASENAHLHLWTTNAFLFESKQIIKAWGFEYRSCFVWVKPQMGMGNYWRVSHEFLLLGVRGSCPFKDHALKSWAELARGKHSAKPDQIRTMIEKAGDGPRLELFARRPAPGWVVWGNEVERTVFDNSVEELVA